jgi:hypothetical protein
MREKVDVPVSVGLYFDHKRRRVFPVKILWEGKEYRVEKVGMYHSYWEGKILHHVFSVVAEGMFFRLVMNGTNLHWRLMEVADGLPD